MLGILLLLVTGYVVYRLIRHPIKSIKFVGAALGLLILGIITYCVIISCAVYMLT